MEEAGKALTSALRSLTRRDHSEAELCRKLRDKGFAEADIEAAIARLKRMGYLDDRRFAERWAESAIRNGRGYGPRLRLELRRRGVADSLIEEVLKRLEVDYSELETLISIVERKFARFDPASADDREKRRIIGYLQRRGFSLTTIFAALRGYQGCRGDLF